MPMLLFDRLKIDALFAVRHQHMIKLSLYLFNLFNSFKRSESSLIFLCSLCSFVILSSFFSDWGYGCTDIHNHKYISCILETLFTGI